jgi:putative ABC transport system permease protein
LFGLILGVGGSVILALVTGFPLMPSWPVVVLALVTSILVGLLSGYLPARRAAHLRPVLALRYE